MKLSRRSLLATTAAAAASAAVAAPAQAAPGGNRPLRTGFERLDAEGYASLRGQRIGIVTNPTGVTRDVRHIVDVMHAD
ncbi:twin-arginine translocation signal domain-containing protein, partial [Streptomyces sp. NPDC056159]